jgi:hypothetical protein
MDTGDPSPNWWRDVQLPPLDGPDMVAAAYVERDPSTLAAIAERITRERDGMERDPVADGLAWAARPTGPAIPDWESVSPHQQVVLNGWWMSEIREAIRDSPTTRRNTRSTRRIGTEFHEMRDDGVVATTRNGRVIRMSRSKARRSRYQMENSRPPQPCSFFQLRRSCDRPSTCPYKHICATCTSSDHGAVTCPRANHVTPHRAVGAESTPTGMAAMAAETHRPRHFVGLGEMSLF